MKNSVTHLEIQHIKKIGRLSWNLLIILIWQGGGGGGGGGGGAWKP